MGKPNPDTSQRWLPEKLAFADASEATPKILDGAFCKEAMIKEPINEGLMGIRPK